ncbi:MAG: hypothetical protein AAFY08_13005 [Planctomycetota bacterium]
MSEAETMTKEHPILFTGPMVRAILAGRKTRTRRVVTRSRSLFDGDLCPASLWDELDFSAAWVDPGPSPAGNAGPYLKVPRPAEETVHRVYSRVVPGDSLVPRTTWATTPEHDDTKPLDLPANATIWSQWLGGNKRDWMGKSRPGRFLPKHLWWSAPRLTVTGVRVERVQSISQEDAMAEGIEITHPSRLPGHGTPGVPVGFKHYLNPEYRESCSPQHSFRTLWDSINGKKPGHAWGDNPWVWVIEFEKKEQAIAAERASGEGVA